MAYTFKQIEAHDPNNPGLVAPNAMVTIFAPGDPAMTPLTLTTLDGQPLTNPVKVNGLGYGPPFMHATLDQVAWAGGGLTGTFESYQGMKEEAIAARAAAENAGATAAAAAQQEFEDRVAAGEFVGPAGADGANVLPTDTAIKNAIEDPASQTKAALSATYVGAFAPSTSIVYDAAGNVSSATEGGITTTFTYNTDGTVATETRLGKVRTWTYDTAGNPTSSTVV